MKTKTIITELNQEDLVDLLCTATYGSSWLECNAPDREGLDVTEQDCLEDVWAKALLAGKKIECIDHYAEGVSYGTLPHETDEDENVTYQVTLEDVKKGLQACADGTFKEDCGGTLSWLKECFAHFADPENGRMQMDLPEADAIMQVIMFGELIYG